MFIARTHRNNVYVIAEKMEWANVEAAIPAEIEAALRKWQADYDAVQEYLGALYIPLRQTGAADISKVEVPACLSDRASKQTSTSGSRKKKSTSATKKKASNSGSPSPEDTSAPSAEADGS